MLHPSVGLGGDWGLGIGDWENEGDERDEGDEGKSLLLITHYPLPNDK
ncbi:hypothetical protein H6G27_21850 [Nostoc linckia FACHB-104]|nr:hypothetical protein [Nostoc linckia FACHB-104]